jgi:hypothetical protein
MTTRVNARDILMSRGDAQLSGVDFGLQTMTTARRPSFRPEIPLTATAASLASIDAVFESAGGGVSLH